MKIKKIIDKILSKRDDLNEEKILVFIKDKKEDFHGLLSDEGAGLLVAQDLGIDLELNEKFGELQISDLLPGLNDVTITGRVLSVWPLKEFEKADGGLGKLTKLILADKTDKISCLFWNSKAEQISDEKGLQGKILQISHGYTREGNSGEVELHLGDRGNIIVSPNVSEENYPALEDLFSEKSI